MTTLPKRMLPGQLKLLKSLLLRADRAAVTTASALGVPASVYDGAYSQARHAHSKMLTFARYKPAVSAVTRPDCCPAQAAVGSLTSQLS
jgi:hypothetical protein